MGGRSGASRLIVVTFSVLLVNACSAGSGHSGDTAPPPQVNSGRATGSQTPPPKPVTVEKYSATLAGAINPLASALSRLAEAKAYKGLDDRVAQVETAAGQAVTKLSPITPPAQLVKGHSQLITALRAFHGELGKLSAQVDGRTLCTGAAVRADLGDADATSALRSALATVSAKLPDHGSALKLPPAGQQVGSRPSNGKLIRAASGYGRGELTIDNGGSADALVTLSKGRRPAVSVYVRKRKTYTVKGVPDGSYAVFFTGGAVWDDKARAFGHRCVFQRFEDQLRFRTTRTATQILWTNFTITLEPVVGGTARTADVDPNDFPS